ncbi:MAG TPA: hypothetical protein VIX82_09650, partial [Solirubrobacteraceae bacterium]
KRLELKATVRRNSSVYRPDSRLRVFQASGPDRTDGVAAMATPGRALSQKALVGISPAFANAGLASSPRSGSLGTAILLRLGASGFTK